MPHPLRKDLMASLHSMDHPGIKLTLARVAEEYYWPSIKGDVKKFVKMCEPCIKVKSGKKQVNTCSFNVPDKRFSHVMVDAVGPLPSSYGYCFLLTAICRSTQFLHAMLLKEASALEVASAFLHQWVPRLGLPSVVTCDNGASFTANLWKGILSKLNIKVQYSALYRPQSIGMLERQHRGIKDSLKTAIAEMGVKYQDQWLNLTLCAAGALGALQPDIGASSSEMVFGTNVHIPGQIL